MNGLTLFLWSLLLCSVCTTIETRTSSSTSIASHYKNAKYQESSPSSGILSTVAGYKTRNEGSLADGILATSRKLDNPQGLAVDKEANFFIAASTDNKIWKVTASSGIITTRAGTGVASYSGDGGQATTATLNRPYDVALDTTGNIYIADTGNSRIRKVTVSTGVITTVAGDGNAAYVSDNVAATSTSLYEPYGLALDASGNIYIADTGNRRIRKVTASTGIITTIAGSGDISGAFGVKSDIATKYFLWGPTGVALDSAGDVYIAGSSGDYCVFKVTVSTGIITIVAGGTGAGGYSGDDILATKAQLSTPKQVAFDASDNMFINDAYNYRIRRVSASTGIITTVAGTGEASIGMASAILGDGGSAILQSIYTTRGLAVVANGDFYFSNDYLNVVKKVTYTTGTPSSSVTAAPAVTPAMTPSTPSTATAPTPSASSPPSTPAPTASTEPTAAPTPTASAEPTAAPTSTPAPTASTEPTAAPTSTSVPTSAEPTAAPTSTPAPTARTEPSISKAPAVTPSTPSTATAPTPSASSPSSPSISKAPAVTPSTPSTATAPTPSASSPSSPSISKAPAGTPSTPSTATAPTPSASSPSLPSISKAPSTSPTTAPQNSATTHVAQTLHVTMILLSSFLILHLC